MCCLSFTEVTLFGLMPPHLAITCLCFCFVFYLLLECYSAKSACHLISCSTSESLMSPVKQAPRKSPSDTEVLVNSVPIRSHQVNGIVLWLRDYLVAGKVVFFARGRKGRFITETHTWKNIWIKPWCTGPCGEGCSYLLAIIFVIFAVCGKTKLLQGD